LRRPGPDPGPLSDLQAKPIPLAYLAAPHRTAVPGQARDDASPDPSALKVPELA